MFCSIERTTDDMSHPFWLKANFALEGQMFKPVYCVRSIAPKFVEGISQTLVQMFISLRQCADGIGYFYYFKVIVQWSRNREITSHTPFKACARK